MLTYLLTQLDIYAFRFWRNEEFSETDTDWQITGKSMYDVFSPLSPSVYLQHNEVRCWQNIKAYHCSYLPRDTTDGDYANCFIKYTGVFTVETFQIHDRTCFDFNMNMITNLWICPLNDCGVMQCVNAASEKIKSQTSISSILITKRISTFSHLSSSPLPGETSCNADL